MRTSIIWLGCWLSLSCAVGCSDSQPDQDDFIAQTEKYQLELLPASGAWNLRSVVDDVEARRLHFAVEVIVEDRVRIQTSLNHQMNCERSLSPEGQTVFECVAETAGAIEVRARFILDPDALLLETDFENPSDQAVELRKIYPFRLSADKGGSLQVGGHAGQVRILQNGTDEIIDYYVAIHPGDTELTDPYENPLFLTHSSYSNGSAVTHNLESGESLLAGFVEFGWATPLIALAGEPGKESLTCFQAEARYPKPVEIEPGQSISGGQAVFILGAKTPFEALESYADRIAEHWNIQLPPHPHSGWDSWYTSYENTDISEAFILENARALAAWFKDFGLDSLQIDMGWQASWGDWIPKDTFPSGLQSVAAAIAAEGIRPELWFAPLTAEESSLIYQQHKDDWFAEKDMWGTVLMGSEMHPFDLSNPEVLEHISSLGRQIKEWGFDNVKMDFAYYTLFADLEPDLVETPNALYRNAIREFHAALGDDIYFINISMCFPNYGLVDGFRLGLDDWPCWEGGPDCEGYSTAGGIGAQGIKPVVRTAARRYWMNGRIWYNHHDQIYFRDLSQEESRAFISMASLSGGMISLGEDARTLTPQQADAYRRILPLTSLTARPTDLFEKEFPEIWHLEYPDSDGQLIGLFHWGSNRDLTVNPYSERADTSPVTHTVDLGSLGLDPNSNYLAYEFWTDSYLGISQGSFELELEPHTARVVKLIEEPQEPTFLSTNRHLLMGPGIVEDCHYDPALRQLTGSVKTVADFNQTLVFVIPDGFLASAVDITGVSGVIQDDSRPNLLVLSFNGPDTKAHTFRLDF
ncbi:MAG: alpha-galactosidase [Deltaproteobacteria bacterium]|nr:alpha-galactosidase [Deltaproteobacteria bacterium]